MATFGVAPTGPFAVCTPMRREPFAFLQSQGFDAEHHVCRCAYDGGRADWLRLGGIFGQALHAASDKGQKSGACACGGAIDCAACVAGCPL